MNFSVNVKATLKYFLMHERDVICHQNLILYLKLVCSYTEAVGLVTQGCILECISLICESEGMSFLSLYLVNLLYYLGLHSWVLRNPVLWNFWHHPSLDSFPRYKY